MLRILQTCPTPASSAIFPVTPLCCLHLTRSAQRSCISTHSPQACLPLAVSVAFSEGSLLFATLRTRIRKSDYLTNYLLFGSEFLLDRIQHTETFKATSVQWNNSFVTEAMEGDRSLVPTCCFYWSLIFVGWIISSMASEPSASARNVVRVPSKLPTNRVS